MVRSGAANVGRSKQAQRHVTATELQIKSLAMSGLPLDLAELPQLRYMLSSGGNFGLNGTPKVS
jgi:hypothetical protein